MNRAPEVAVTPAEGDLVLTALAEVQILEGHLGRVTADYERTKRQLLERLEAAQGRRAAVVEVVAAKYLGADRAQYDYDPEKRVFKKR